MRKHHNIEFLRFAFSIIIVYFHILHANIIPYTSGQSAYLTLQSNCRIAYTLVEVFAIIAGYFLYQSYTRSPEKNFMEFALHRFIRVWPVFAFYMLCYTSMKGDITEFTLLDLALLRCTGLSLTDTEIIWYVAPFFWCSLLLFGILKLFKKGTAALIISLIAYGGYLINLNYLDGSVGNIVIWDVVSLAMLRVGAGMSIGILIGMGIKEISAAYKLELPLHSWMSTAFFSLVEIICMVMLLGATLLRKPYITNAFTVVVIFVVMFVCFINRLGMLSRFLDKPIFAWAGKYAYSIYVMQQISFDIMEKTFWQSKEFLFNHVKSALLISVVISVLFGILVYYLIERPAYSIFQKWEKKHKRINISVE